MLIPLKYIAGSKAPELPHIKGKERHPQALAVSSALLSGCIGMITIHLILIQPMVISKSLLALMIFQFILAH